MKYKDVVSVIYFFNLFLIEVRIFLLRVCYHFQIKCKVEEKKERVKFVLLSLDCFGF